METRFGAPVAGDEKSVLSGFLDHYRAMMVRICDGLGEEDLRRPMVPTGTSLIGMVKHLAYVERGWFQETIAGEEVDYPFDVDDPSGDFRVAPDETFGDVVALYRAECARSREILDRAGLDDLALGKNRRRDYNVRWIVVHMIEETARHAGHADILRELIDGAVGAGYE